MFEGARVDQAFLALASKVNANFILHTRQEGVRVGAIRIGEIEHSHLPLDKPCFLSQGLLVALKSLLIDRRLF
jgi:hypothetical protein